MIEPTWQAYLDSNYSACFVLAPKSTSIIQDTSVHLCNAPRCNRGLLEIREDIVHGALEGVLYCVLGVCVRVGRGSTLKKRQRFTHIGGKEVRPGRCPLQNASLGSDSIAVKVYCKNWELLTGTSQCFCRLLAFSILPFSNVAAKSTHCLSCKNKRPANFQIWSSCPLKICK